MSAHPAAKLFEPHDGIYLLSHSVGLPIRGGADELQTYASEWATDPAGVWPRWLSTVDAFRASLAALLGGDASSVCPQSNVSSGIVKIIGSLRATLSEQPTVLLSEDAFPSLAYAADLAGCELRFVRRDVDATDPAIWAQHLDDARPDIVLVTHVHSNTGQLVPAAEVTHLARQRGVISVVDVAQSAGIIEVDVNVWAADFIVGSCVKWLSGGPGAGWLWVDAPMIERCRPTDVGWFSHEDPFEFDVHDFRYADDALRFWGGTPSVLPFALARRSIDAVHSVGVGALRQRNQEVIDAMIDVLGDRVVSPIEPERRSGTVIAQGSETWGHQLADAGIAVDQRAVGVRMTPHVHTDEAALLEALGTA